VSIRGSWVVARQALTNVLTPSVRAIKNYTLRKELVLATSLQMASDVRFRLAGQVVVGVGRSGADSRPVNELPPARAVRR
jgi:hypothetical protein